MSAEAVMSEIIEPMQRLFLPPRAMPEAQVSQALREYIDALQGFDAEDLRAAWVKARETHGARSWPPIALFVVTARINMKDRGAVDTIKTKYAKPSFTEFRLTWEAARRAPKALEAAEMGVAWSLKCAILNDGKGLDQVDLRELRLAKNSAERTAAAIERFGEIEYNRRILRFEDGANRDMAISMWRKLLRNEEETADEIRTHQPRHAA